MKYIKLAFAALRWADHLDDEGFYRNKRFFVQTVALASLFAATFGFDLQMTAEQTAAIVAGLMAATDVGTRFVGKKIDAKAHKQSVDAPADEPKKHKGSRNPKL